MGIIFLQGLPGSGKTHWATSKTKSSPKTFRVNKDELRAMLSARPWNPADERVVCRIEEIITDHLLLDDDNDVIVDNTHLNPSHEVRYRELAEVCGKEFFKRVFKTPLATCLSRVAERNAKGQPPFVPLTVVEQMYNAHKDLLTEETHGNQKRSKTKA